MFTHLYFKTAYLAPSIKSEYILIIDCISPSFRYFALDRLGTLAVPSSQVDPRILGHQHVDFYLYTKHWRRQRPWHQLLRFKRYPVGSSHPSLEGCSRNRSRQNCDSTCFGKGSVFLGPDFQKSGNWILPGPPPAEWKVLGKRDSATISGRLLGGCVETLSRLAGTLTHRFMLSLKNGLTQGSSGICKAPGLLPVKFTAHSGPCGKTVGSAMPTGYCLDDPGVPAN